MTEIDTTKPNIGRIYDYVLGGNNNFESDRVAAEQIMKVFPPYPHWAKLNRWFLQMVVEQWVEQGYQHIVDFGSGLPTQGNIHEIAPGAHILYSDRDPVVVAYAQELLQTTPSIQYIHGDAHDPQPILAAATAFFGSERPVAIGCIGLVYFLDDAALSGLMQALYDWATPGSIVALTQSYAEIITSDNQATLDAFKRSGAEMFLRNEAEICRMVAPWHVRAISKPLATWLNLENMLEESDRAGGNVDMFGLILERSE